MDLTEGQKKYHKYLQTDHWKTLRDFALFRNWRKNNGILKCDDCGKTGVTGFDVHHNKYPSGGDYENLDNPHYHIVLCHRCHEIIHDKIELSEKEKKEREDSQKCYMKDTMKAMLDSMNKKGKK